MDDQLAALHRSVRQLQAAFAALVLAFGLGAVAAFRPSDDVQDVIRMRGIVIVDASGRERIILGARVRAGGAERFERSLLRVDTAYRVSIGLHITGGASRSVTAPPTPSTP